MMPLIGKHLVVVCGKSGAGKSTLIDKLTSLDVPGDVNLRIGLRYTTREPRVTDNRNSLRYVSSDEPEPRDSSERTKHRIGLMERLVENGTLEDSHFCNTSGHAQGWEEKDLRPTPYELVLIDVSDPENAERLKRKYDATVIFLDVPSDELERRIASRGGTDEQITDRIAALEINVPNQRRDCYGREHALGFGQKFKGYEGLKHGVADIVVENTADLSETAAELLKAINHIAMQKLNPFFVPDQLKVLPVPDIDGSEQIRIGITRPGFINTHKTVMTGLAPQYPNPIQAEEVVSTDYDRAVTLVKVQDRFRMNGAPAEVYHSVIISPFGEEVNYDKLRRGHFRGRRITPQESWHCSGENAPALEGYLVRNGLVVSKPAMFGDDELRVSNPQNGVVPYSGEKLTNGKVRNILEDSKQLNVSSDVQDIAELC